MLEQHVIEVHAIAPFVLPMIAMAAQLGKGLIDQGRANKMNALADRQNAAIPLVDPGIQAQLNEIRMRQRYAETGQSRIAALKRQMAMDANEQTQSNLLRGSGTSPGALQQGMLRSQNQTQRALMQAGAESEQLVPQYMQMETPLISDIADRALSLQQYLRDKTAFQSAQTQQNANTAITGAIGLMSDLDLDGLIKKKPKGKVIGAPANGNGAEVKGLGDPGVNNPWWNPTPLGATGG